MASKGQTLESFDIHAPGGRVGAECVWARMREMDGLYRSEDYGGYYVAARYEDVMTVLMNPQVFASGKGITLPPPDTIRSFHIPAETDPPEHREYRGLMAPLLSANHARDMEPAIRDIARGLIAKIPDGEPMDFVRAFARPLPILVALDLMRLPRAHAGALEEMVVDLHREVASGVPTGAADRLKRFSEQVLEDRRADASDPNSDVVASILLGKAFDRSLTPDEQMSMVRQILVGGFDTTSIALATMMKWIAENPQAAAQLRGEPKRIDLASEEIVRFSSPSTYLRREVVEDYELAGTQLKKGDSVLIAFGAANHDPSKFTCPADVVSDRKPNMHVGFGAGRHRCVGSFLAKAQMRVAFEEILAHFDSFQIEPDPPIAYTTGLGQGIISLPMRMGVSRDKH